MTCPVVTVAEVTSICPALQTSQSTCLCTDLLHSRCSPSKSVLSYYPHFLGEETETQKLKLLPHLTQLCSNGARLPLRPPHQSAETARAPAPCGHQGAAGDMEMHATRALRDRARIAEHRITPLHTRSGFSSILTQVPCCREEESEGSAKTFCKTPGSEYFRLCSHICLCSVLLSDYFLVFYNLPL